jgi:hypothetical protein
MLKYVKRLRHKLHAVNDGMASAVATSAPLRRLTGEGEGSAARLSTASS